MGEQMGFAVVFDGGQICSGHGARLEDFFFAWGRNYWHMEAEARDSTDHAKMHRLMK